MILVYVCGWLFSVALVLATAVYCNRLAGLGFLAVVAILGPFMPILLFAFWVYDTERRKWHLSNAYGHRQKYREAFGRMTPDWSRDVARNRPHTGNIPAERYRDQEMYRHTAESWLKQFHSSKNNYGENPNGN